MRPAREAYRTGPRRSMFGVEIPSDISARGFRVGGVGSVVMDDHRILWLVNAEV